MLHRIPRPLSIGPMLFAAACLILAPGTLSAQKAEPQDDHRGSIEYKRSLVKTLTIRALRQAVDRLKGGRS